MFVGTWNKNYPRLQSTPFNLISQSHSASVKSLGIILDSSEPTVHGKQHLVTKSILDCNQHPSTCYHSPTLCFCQKPQHYPRQKWAHCPRKTTVSQTSKSCYYQLLWISSVQKYLSTETTVKWSSHSFYHALTTQVLSFLVFLLPLSIAFGAFRTMLLVSSWKDVKLTTPLFQTLQWLPIPQTIQYKINTLCYKCISELLHFISVTVSNFTHPLALSTLLLILSASRLLVPDFAWLVCVPFSSSDPLHEMTFPSPSKRKPPLDPFQSNPKT